MNEQANAIRSAALERLATETAELGRQSLQAERLTGAALALTVAIVIFCGFAVPRTITQPLVVLLAATRRLNEGDYTVSVATNDRAELGQLAASFNQMIAALRKERTSTTRRPSGPWSGRVAPILIGRAVFSML